MTDHSSIYKDMKDIHQPDLSVFTDAYFMKRDTGTRFSRGSLHKYIGVSEQKCQSSVPARVLQEAWQTPAQQHCP